MCTTWKGSSSLEFRHIVAAFAKVDEPLPISMVIDGTDIKHGDMVLYLPYHFPFGLLEPTKQKRNKQRSVVVVNNYYISNVVM